MPPRIHPLFPTREQTTKKPSLAYSDHLPILTRVPLGEGRVPLNIISLNILAKADASGVHSRSYREKDEEAIKKRFRRIAKGLGEGVLLNDVDVVVLQETSKLMVRYLKKELKKSGKSWKIVVDDQGLISCYNKERLVEQSRAFDVIKDSRVDSFKFVDKDNDDLTVDVHNIWGHYSPLPERLETVCRDKLVKTDSEVSIIIGDTNSRIAPLDNAKRNLATGAIPPMFNAEAGASDEVQIPDHPDGGFYRNKADGKIHQLETEVLHFKTGKIVKDDRSQEEIGSWPDYRMVMCLDDSYRQEVIGGKNIFAYETQMRDEFSSQNLLVRMATDIFNNKAIGINFPISPLNKNKSTIAAFTAIEERLCLVEGFQFHSVVDQDGAEYGFVFAPVEKADLLARVILQINHPEEWKASLNYKLVSQIDTQIQKLSKSSFFLRDASAKITSLNSLKDQIEMAELNDPKKLSEIVGAWENESSSHKNKSNVDLMGMHRNVFFKSERPGVETSTVTMFRTLKETLAKVKEGAVEAEQVEGPKPHQKM